MIPNSQVHKFADELRFLAQQTSELEQHLTSLRKAIEDLQDQQSEVTTKHHAVKLDNPSF
jgi:predicted  nucleic acid-binding Zn-ribbon protein